MELDATGAAIAAEALKEIRSRLQFLKNVGLEYLTLDRTAPTLSGGEMQRIRLAGQIGCGLVGVLYILDEPSIGLHPRDNDKLLETLAQLRDQGNTVVVVEHDEDTMRAADHIVDFGPGPGVRGGRVVAAGTLAEVTAAEESLTGRLSFRPPADRSARRPPRVGQRSRTGSSSAAPATIISRTSTSRSRLGVFVCVTGVSGSGKSSLVSDILVEALHRDLNAGIGNPGEFDKIEGLEHLDKMIAIDQSPIGRTPRSNPATYIKVFDEIRRLYTQLPEAKAKGFEPGRFSFNVSGGRCEACEGNGSTKLEMDFLADIWVTCPVCEGHRFNRETLQVRYKGKSIAEVLEMDVQEALAHFENIPADRRQAPHAARGGPGLREARPAVAHALRRRGPADQARPGTRQEEHRPDALSARRADDRPALCRHPVALEGAARFRRGRQHGARGRTQRRGDQDGRLDHRPGPGRRRRRRADHRHRHAGAGGGDAGVVHRAGAEAVAGARVGQASGAGEQRQISGATGDQARSWPALAGRWSHPTAMSLRAAPELATAIKVRGARQHNLKGIDVEIPRDQMTVCCGPSGSGKTSLAMDTIYAEGQRRYVESLSSYARQFVDKMQKPRLDHIEGLSPAIAIEQKHAGHSPRSTVGTVTEIYDYLRILVSRLGRPYCPACDLPVGTQTADEIIDKIMQRPAGTRLYLMAPLEIEVGEKYEALWEEMRASGYVRVRIDGQTHSLDQPPQIDRRRKHRVEVVIDRVTIRPDGRSPGARSRVAGAWRSPWPRDAACST